jgi:hypothetical protein
MVEEIFGLFGDTTVTTDMATSWTHFTCSSQTNSAPLASVNIM